MAIVHSYKKNGNKIMDSTARSNPSALPPYITEIGSYYEEDGKIVLHGKTPLCEIFAGSIKEMLSIIDSPIRDLKKLAVLFKRASHLTISADQMLYIQRVYATLQDPSNPQVSNDSKERLPIVSNIIDLLKTKGSLPENETAVFNSGKREKSLWFLSGAKIETVAATEKTEVNLKDKKLTPIHYCEEHDHEVPPLPDGSSVRIIFVRGELPSAILRLILSHDGG